METDDNGFPVIILDGDDEQNDRILLLGKKILLWLAWFAASVGVVSFLTAILDSRLDAAALSVLIMVLSLIYLIRHKKEWLG